MDDAIRRRLIGTSEKVANFFFYPVFKSDPNLETRLRHSVTYEALCSKTDSISRQRANKRISQLLEDSEPRLISRFGSTEFRVVRKYYSRETRSPLEKAYAAISRLEAPLWTKWEHQNLSIKSGFYPIERTSVDQFVKLSAASAREIDLLGSWVPGENQMRHLFPRASLAHLSGLNPFGVDKPWTRSLEGKRVLVIHPFEETIREQFRKLPLLFDAPDFMPSFELLTLRAVQSLGERPPAFPTWFDGLNHMVKHASELDFDIALIACGAYGQPLGAELKRAGRKAFVLGGILQLLFGIKGRRWDSDGLYREGWVRPLSSEKPQGYLGADKGAYW